MPKDKNNGREMTPDEKFRSFFSTTAVDIPEEMTRRDENQPEEKPQKRFGLFGRGKEKQETDEAAAEQPQEMPTGEVRLGEDAQPEPEADLELMLKPEADPEQELAPWPFLEKEAEDAQPEAPAKKPEEKSAPQTAEPPAAVKPETPRQSAVPAARPAEQHSTAKPLRHPKNAPEVLLPQEEQEQQEMAQLKAMINGLSDQKPEKPAPRAEAAPAAETEPAESKKKPSGAPLPAAVFAAVKETAPELQPEPVPQPEKTEQPVADFFGKAQSEDAPQAPLAPAEEPAAKEDTMSLPLLPLDGEEPQQAPEKAPAAPQPELKAEAEDAVSPEEHAETELTEPEATADKLHRMSAELTLRCVLGGILAVVLLHFGLVSDGLLPAMAALDPDAAPAAFYGANLLLLAASLCVSFPVLRDGLNGLRGRPSSETMPALAAVAALVQAVTAMLNANVYRGTTGISLLSGMAALGLFLALLGSRVMLAAVKGGYELVTNGVEFEGAYRAKDKDLLRALARDLEQKDPWVLLSRPMKEADGFVEQSLSERASERRARKVSYILLGVALLSGVLFLLAGAGWNKAAAAMAAVLCMGAPLSSTLIAGVASLRLQRAAAAVGAVVPGWQAIEQLGGIDTLQIDADDLFTADSAQLEDIRIFKGGRIDRAILYAASVLNESHGTLKGLFRQIVEERTDILFPVKDLEQHHGLGFSAWCDNNRILIGTRSYLEQEGVPLPDEEYEMQHSKNGELQILYLAVSGNLHAMFVLKYVGGRNVARGLAVLQKENIRLLVTCQDPSLTAHHITEAYRLPEGMITVLDQEQCNAIKAAPEDPEDTCCMIHLKAFASLTGGLQAADQAQNAESSATTVQMVSVLFSIIIAALLTSAGSIWELSVATVLMYQAAWSALSIAVCALKQHN
ncbi:cell envelope biogenesis protein OmpA [uncultured Faecalibacterium sp.]|uniref:cell envelope biogenesis protein OmpA n=1 Tax=uncultured Faecalibacterium sp. TaxID=259315 RepID=UPI00260D6910|nr:cell envelope biogenesis protein OmpA [uncultured Faecalibacterium sp.]